VISSQVKRTAKSQAMGEGIGGESMRRRLVPKLPYSFSPFLVVDSLPILQTVLARAAWGIVPTDSEPTHAVLSGAVREFGIPEIIRPNQEVEHGQYAEADVFRRCLHRDRHSA